MCTCVALGEDAGEVMEGEGAVRRGMREVRGPKGDPVMGMTVTSKHKISAAAENTQCLLHFWCVWQRACVISTTWH